MSYANNVNETWPLGTNLKFGKIRLYDRLPLLALRWIIAGGKYFMHMGTLLVTVDVLAPNLIGWIWEHQCTGVVREPWDVNFCFSIWRHRLLDWCAWCKLTEYRCRMRLWEWTRTFQIWITRVDINHLEFTIFLDRLTVIEYSTENQRLLRSYWLPEFTSSIRGLDRTHQNLPYWLHI